MKSIGRALLDLLATVLFVLSLPVILVVALFCPLIDKLRGLDNDDW